MGGDTSKDFQDFLANQGIADDRNEQVQRATSESFQAAMVIAAAFMTPAGQMCLAELRERTIEKSCFVPGEADSYGYLREGQNSIVRFIETCVRVARQGPPNATQPETTPPKTTRKRS